MLSTLIETVKGTSTSKVSSGQLSPVLEMIQLIRRQIGKSSTHIGADERCIHNQEDQRLQDRVISHINKARAEFADPEYEAEGMEGGERVNGLSEIINRLCGYAEETETKYFTGDEAYSIIDDLEVILNALCQLQNTPRETGKRKRGNQSLSTEESRELKRMKGILISSPSIVVNANGTRDTTERWTCSRSKVSL